MKPFSGQLWRLFTGHTGSKQARQNILFKVDTVVLAFEKKRKRWFSSSPDITDSYERYKSNLSEFKGFALINVVETTQRLKCHC